MRRLFAGNNSHASCMHIYMHSLFGDGMGAVYEIFGELWIAITSCFPEERRQQARRLGKASFRHVTWKGIKGSQETKGARPNVGCSSRNFSLCESQRQYSLAKCI